MLRCERLEKGHSHWYFNGNIPRECLMAGPPFLRFCFPSVFLGRISWMCGRSRWDCACLMSYAELISVGRLNFSVMSLLLVSGKSPNPTTSHIHDVVTPLFPPFPAHSLVALESTEDTALNTLRGFSLFLCPTRPHMYKFIRIFTTTCCCGLLVVPSTASSVLCAASSTGFRGLTCTTRGEHDVRTGPCK